MDKDPHEAEMIQHTNRRHVNWFSVVAIVITILVEMVVVGFALSRGLKVPF